MRVSSVTYGVIIASVAMIMLTGHAHAYLDPVTVSFFLQSMVAGGVAVMATAGFHWRRAKLILGRLLGTTIRDS